MKYSLNSLNRTHIHLPIESDSNNMSYGLFDITKSENCSYLLEIFFSILY